MEDAFIVQGGVPLRGKIELSGAKNVALKILIAALLFDTPLSFTNIPNIEDVRELLHLLSLLGAKISQEQNHVTIDPSTLSHNTVDLLHGSKIRVSFMLFAPLLYKFKQAIIPNPGGCRLGARPIDRHIAMLEAFGVKIVYNENTGFYTASLSSKGFTGNTYTFEKSSHTGTELAIMVAVCAQGVSTIYNAAQEPEVDDLISFFNLQGAKIKRTDNAIHIEGIEKLQPQSSPYQIMYDELEAATYGVFALATGGDITIKHTIADHLTDFIDKVKAVGGGVEIKNGSVRFYAKGELTPANVITVPYPGFRTDWQAQWAALMTQSHGVSIIHETVFENKFGYVPELRKMGAKIDFFQPNVDAPDKLYQFTITDELKKNMQQAVRIAGPTKLHNAALKVTDIRAGATVLIAACMAEGESVIQGASIIDRGYEHIEKKLTSLGAQIKRI